MVNSTVEIPLELDKEIYWLFLAWKQYCNSQSNSNFINESFTEEECSNLLATAKRMSLLQVVAHSFNMHPSFVKFQPIIESYKKVTEIIHHLQNHEAIRINDILTKHKVPHLFFKGLYFNNSIYKDGAKSISGDIDILVPKADIPKVKSLLIEHGFSQNQQFIKGHLVEVNDLEIEKIETEHYELYPFNKFCIAPELNGYKDFIERYIDSQIFLFENDRTTVSIQLDVHHGLSHGIDHEDVWSNPQSFILNNNFLNSLSNETLFWFLSARFYHETMILNEKKVKLLTAVAKLCQLELDYKEVLRVTNKYSLHPSLFYVSLFLKKFFDIPIPEEFIEELASKKSSGIRDWGDFQAKILDRDPLYNIILRK